MCQKEYGKVVRAICNDENCHGFHEQRQVSTISKQEQSETA